MWVLQRNRGSGSGASNWSRNDAAGDQMLDNDATAPFFISLSTIHVVDTFKNLVILCGKISSYIRYSSCFK